MQVLLKLVVFHPSAKVEIKAFPESVKKEMGELLFKLQQGKMLTMPHSKPMSTVGSGVHELRVKGPEGVKFMKRKLKTTVCRTPQELAAAMGLDPCHAIEWELRSSVTDKIIESSRKSEQTVTDIAKKAQTSRARVTRILKGDSYGMSLDVLFKILAAVGQRIQISYKKAA